MAAPLAAAPPAGVAVEVVRRGGRHPGGPMLVCLPFAGGGARAYAPLLRHLPRTWTVVSGRAVYGAGADLAAAADAWCAAVGPHLRPGTILFGHSLGGAVAAELARRHPGRLTGVRVVVSAPPVRLSPRLLAAARRRDHDALLDVLDAGGLLPATGLTRDEVRRWVVPGFAADLRVVRKGWPADPPAVPVTVLVGADDPVCGPADLARLAGWPVEGVHVVDGGHYFCLDRPERVAALLAGVAAGNR